MRRYLTAGLDRLSIQQLEDIIADAEVLLEKRRQQAEQAPPAHTLARAHGQAPQISYRGRPSARD
ncbi:hypothetical protein [Isoalcanivorax beigongshangi]|uniref:Uncharacterized protein n=1 Tax=Isoalcanivorax beigongshangi TaxID=3238810 RepID=A0ABV4AE60_9GAMM